MLVISYCSQDEDVHRPLPNQLSHPSCESAAWCFKFKQPQHPPCNTHHAAGSLSNLPYNFSLFNLFLSTDVQGTYISLGLASAPLCPVELLNCINIIAKSRGNPAFEWSGPEESTVSFSLYS